LNAKNTVSQIMAKKVFSTEASRTVIEALQIMVGESIGSVVVTQDNAPVGILTQKDVVKWLVRDKELMSRKMREVMSQPLVSVPPDTVVIEALNLMRKKDIRHLPVVSDQRLDGIVTIHRELLYWLLGGGNRSDSSEPATDLRV
jgi:CBS domain-containing protein